MSVTEKIVHRLARLGSPRADRRGFLAGAAVMGAAVAVDPWGYLVRPANAYDTVCGSGAACADGWSVFCCTINGGINSCPPDSFIGGWWKADGSSFCGGAARYYIDCNAYADGHWKCHCASGTCDSRRVACNQFRYGQCSLEVPAENTGPVVCRMISCTPPWQQFAGVCTNSSATDDSTATHSAPCLGVPPVGSLDSVTVDGAAIRIQGWAFDPDQPVTAVQIVVRVDGGVARTAVTTGTRPDVDAAYRVSGHHGFDLTVPAAPGRHTVAVGAVSIGGGPDAALGSRPVVVAPPANLPIGRLDAVTALPGELLRIAGWAVDLDQSATAIQVAVYLDGRGVGWFPTGLARADVNQAYGIPGRHGFSIDVAAAPGRHRVDVFGINVAGGRGNPLLGSAQASVTGTLPIGRLDLVATGSGSAVLSGWAFDPDRPATSIPVAVYRDGVGLSWFPTDQARPDVNRAHGLTGSHGFQISVECAPGSHEFTVYAIDIAPAGPNPLIGRASAVVPA